MAKVGDNKQVAVGRDLGIQHWTGNFLGGENSLCIIMMDAENTGTNSAVHSECRDRSASFLPWLAEPPGGDGKIVSQRHGLT